MRLNTKLWIGIICLLAFASISNFLISATSANRILSDRLSGKNRDTAETMALSMSMLDKSQDDLSALASKKFKSGQFEQIKLVDARANTLIDLRTDELAMEWGPNSLKSLFSMNPKPGMAAVTEDGTRYGTLIIRNQIAPAYGELWQSVQYLAAWFLVMILAACAIGTLLLRLLLRPLNQVVAQAKAIGERKFVTSMEPGTAELRQLVRSMNAMSMRVRKMLESESRRVDQLRRQAQIDPVTGLRNRETFIAALEDALSRIDVGSSGVLVFVHLEGLAHLNVAVGRPTVDQMLKTVGKTLARATSGKPEPWVVARLGSVDFAVMATGEDNLVEVGGTLLTRAEDAIAPHNEDGSVQVRVGATSYFRGELKSVVLARADGALAKAEAMGIQMMVAEDPPENLSLPEDQTGWRELLTTSMNDHGVRLGRYPVVSEDGALMHYESPARLNIDGKWLPAGQFIAWATRLELTTRIDLLAIEKTLIEMSEHGAQASVIISAESLSDPGFCNQMIDLLRGNPTGAQRLWIEVPEHGALRKLREFTDFSSAIKEYGCKIGLKHAGQHFSRISDFHEVGLDYLKIDGSFVQAVEANNEHETFLRCLCSVAHSIGLITIATGVDERQSVDELVSLGIDGLTGPGIGRSEASGEVTAPPSSPSDR